MNEQRKNTRPGDLDKFRDEIDRLAKEYLEEGILSKDEEVLDMLSDVYAELLCKDLKSFLSNFRCESDKHDCDGTKHDD